jgi:hypothetical protein
VRRVRGSEFSKASDPMEYISPARTATIEYIAFRYALRYGTVILGWAYLVSILFLSLRLMGPTLGLQVGAALVCVCLTIQIARCGIGASGPLLLFAMTMLVFVWGRPLISFGSERFDLRIIETLTSIPVTADGVRAYFDTLTATMAAFCAAILCFQFAGHQPRVLRGTAPAVFGEEARTIWRSMYLCGVAASLIESALYVRFYLSGATYYDLYTQSSGSVGFPGLSFVASFQFYGYLGILLTYYGDKSPRARKQRFVWTILFIVVSVLGLTRGARGEVFTQLLVGLWLYSFTSRTVLSIWKWALFGAGLAELSHLVETLRAGVAATTDTMPFGNVAKWFIYTQGLSGELVAVAATEFGIKLTNVRFVISPLLSPLRKLIDPSFGAQTEQNGQTSGLLSHELAFRTAPLAYLTGHGAGTSYIAECYCTIGIIGVLVATALLTWTVLQGPTLAPRSRSAMFVFSGCLPYILFVPRESLMLPVIPALKAAALLWLCRRLVEVYVRHRHRSNLFTSQVTLANNSDLHSGRR